MRDVGAQVVLLKQHAQVAVVHVAAAVADLAGFVEFESQRVRRADGVDLVFALVAVLLEEVLEVVNCVRDVAG